MLTCGMNTAYPALHPHSEQRKEIDGKQEGVVSVSGKSGFLGILGLYLKGDRRVCAFNWTYFRVNSWACINVNEMETGFGCIDNGICHSLICHTELKLMRLEKQLTDEI